MALDGGSVGRFLNSILKTPRKKVIVIDDEPLLRECLTKELEGRGYAAHELESKAEAYDWIIANRPDLIISDIKSPGMDGFQFLRWLKANPLTSGIPFIFLTGFADLRNAIESKRLGADDFVSKPYDVDDLAQTIARVLKESSRAPCDQPIPDLPASLSSGEWKFLPWSMLHQIMDDALERTSERMVPLAPDGTWEMNFAIEAGEKLLGCRFSRSPDFGDSTADELLRFRFWLDDEGFKSGIIFSFHKVTPKTRELSELIGIHVVPDEGTVKVLGCGAGQNTNNSILSAIGYNPARLKRSPDFINFTHRVFDEVNLSEGKKLMIESFDGTPGPTEVAISDWGRWGLGFNWNNDKKRRWITAGAIWEFCSTLWLKGRITRDDFGPEPVQREFLFALLSSFSSVRCERQAIVFW